MSDELLPLERFQRAADRHDLGRVLSVQAHGGTHGNTIGLHTECGSWVLRTAVSPIDLAALRRERFFARLVHERSSLESPWPYRIDESDSIFGRPYAIMRRLPGTVLHYGMKVRWPAIGRALGRAIADLHRVTLPHIGDWDAVCDDIVPPNLSPPEWFGRRVRDLVSQAALDDRSNMLIEDLVNEAIPAIGEFQPTYVHGDTGVGNFAGERTADGFSVTGVFDLGGGYAGDPDEDLATPLWWPLYWGNVEASRAFLESYRAEHPPRIGQRPRLCGYAVFSLLANWETGHRQGFDWYGECRTFREWALPLLDQVDVIIR